MAAVLRAVVVGAVACSWAALLAKLVHLWRHPRHRNLWVLCLALGGTAFSMTCQVVAVPLDDATGVPGLGRFLGNLGIMIALCGTRVFISRTRGPVPDDAARHRRPVPRELVLLLLTAGVAAVLFARTPAQPDTEHGLPTRTRHPIYDSPYVYVFTAYLVFALGPVAVRGWSFARLAGRRPVRAGMRLVTLGAATGIGYALLKAGFLAVHDAGADVGEWEWRVVCPAYLATVLLFVAGVTVPSAGARAGLLVRWVRDVRHHRRLAPLWQRLYREVPSIAFLPAHPVRHRLDGLRHARFHLYRRVIEIRDAQLVLRGHVHPDAENLARALARATRHDPREVDALVEAAVLAVALDHKRAGRSPAPGAPPTGRRATRDDARDDATRDAATPDDATPDDAPDLRREARHLELVAHHLATSPLVREVRRTLAPQPVPGGIPRPAGTPQPSRPLR